METAPTETLIPISTVAMRLGLSTRAVYRLVARQEFPPPVKIGGATRFYQSDLDQYLNRLRADRDANFRRIS